jgi:hypothetical protein
MLQEKKTALHWCSINGHKDVCALLVEAHAEVNALDNVRARRFLILFLYTFVLFSEIHVHLSILLFPEVLFLTRHTFNNLRQHVKMKHET